MSKIEIMAPAGNFECLMAAIQGGADSIYFGVGKLNMRSHSANNFTIADLREITRVCSSHGVKSYLALNTIVYQSELEEVKNLLDKAKEAGVTAIIASDMAVICLARERDMEVHASTQLNISNFEAVKFFARFADVIVLARELTLPQIKEISQEIEDKKLRGPKGYPLRLELFVHGALCMSVSGKCYLSLQEYGESANRGSCYQLCRRGYRVTDIETGREFDIKNKYIMSPKDLCTIEFIDKIIASGITVFKIEGRARSAEYVKTVTACYREAADAVEAGSFTPVLASELKEKLAGVFNRGFWDGYYQGARLGEWSEVYGNRANRKKEYVARVTNYFSDIGVAEVLVEADELHLGDDILIIGPTTGCIELIVKEIRVDLEKTDVARRGEVCSIPVPEKLRRSDKIYIWRNTSEQREKE